MVDDVLRMRATIDTTEGLAAIRAWGHEVGYLPGKIKPGLRDAETAFGRLGKAIQETGKQITAVVPALSGFGIGAAGGAIAAGALLRTFSEMATRVVELREASKELGMSERDIRAWGLAAEKVGVSSQTMQQGLKDFKKTTDGLKYNIGGVRDELYGWGAGPIVQRIQAATTQADKLKVAFDFIQAAWKDDPSGFKAHMIAQQLGLGWDAARLSIEDVLREYAKLKEVTKEEQERAKKYADGLRDMSEAWDQLVVKVGTPLFPILTREFKQITDFVDWLTEKGREPPESVQKLNEMRQQQHPGFRGKAAPKPGGGAVPLFGGDIPWLDPDRSPLSTNIEDRRGEAGGGDAGEKQRVIKMGVFDALVDFQSYAAAGGGGMGLLSTGGPFAGGGAGQGGGGGGGGGRHGGGGGGGGGDGDGDGDGTVTYPGGALRRRLGGGGPKVALPTTGPSDGGGAASGNLAAQRAGFMKELEDPKFRNYAIDAMQHEGGIQSNMEQLMNMAAMRHQTLHQALTGAQYGPIRHHLISGNISAKTKALGDAAIAKVGAGSNITDYATDQGMKGDPNFDKYMSNPKYWGMHKVEGAWFSAHGEPGRKWAEQQRARDAAAATAGTAASPNGHMNRFIEAARNSSRSRNAAAVAGDDDGSPPEIRSQEEADRWVFGGGDTRRIDQHINGGAQKHEGHVTLNVHSNGTAARTRSHTKGSLFQKTTLRNYKQMQATDDPVGTVGFEE